MPMVFAAEARNRRSPPWGWPVSPVPRPSPAAIDPARPAARFDAERNGLRGSARGRVVVLESLEHARFPAAHHPRGRSSLRQNLRMPITITSPPHRVASAAPKPCGWPWPMPCLEAEQVDYVNARHSTAGQRQQTKPQPISRHSGARQNHFSEFHQIDDRPFGLGGSGGIEAVAP